MKNDAIIFDIDGTLWDARAINAQGWTKSLAEIGVNKQITVPEMTILLGNTAEKITDILIPDLKDKQPQLLAAVDKNELAAFQNESGVFYDGVIEGVKELSKLYKIFLVSNCQDWYIQTFLKYSGLAPFLNGFDCNGMSGLLKDKMLFKMKSDYSLVNPVYVGDTAGDEEATRLAGMEFIHAAYGFGAPKGTPKKFSSFIELVKYFRSSSLVKSAAVE